MKLRVSHLFCFKTRILRPTPRRCMVLVYSVLMLIILLPLLGQFTTLFRANHYTVESTPPNTVVVPRSSNSSLIPMGRPLISIKDLKLNNTRIGKFCSQYFREASLHRKVEMNAFRARNPDPVCLATHFTPSRMDMFKSLLHFWKGTISAAIYTDNRDYISVKNSLDGILQAGNRSNVFIHIVIKDGVYYPINYLRNIAMRYETGCTYQFLSDIDFMPSPDLHAVLTDYQLSGIFSTSKYLVLVVPAFSMLSNTQNNNISATVPATKEELIRMWDENKLHQFHPKGNGHRVTNYAKWRNSTQPYMIDYEEGYEPYILIRVRTAPHFINLFLQRYGNKVSYFVELHARGFDFLVIPNGFVIHLPHSTQDTKQLFKKIGGCSLKVFHTLKTRLKELQQMQNRNANHSNGFIT